MSSKKKPSTPKSSTAKPAASAPSTPAKAAKPAKTVKTAKTAESVMTESVMTEATMAAAAPAADALVDAASPIVLRDDLVERVARAIARLDPRCPLPPHEVTDDLAVDPNGSYAQMARAALLTR